MNSFARHHLARRRLVKLAVVGASLTLAPAAVAAPARPAVKTGAPSAVTYQSATLNGTVNPSNELTTYFFQYGTTTKYGSQTMPGTLAAGTRTVSVPSPVAGLVPVTKYHFRVVAVNATGASLGADASFTTKSVPLSLAIAALPNPVTFGSPLSVVGTLTGTGAANREVVLQGNPYPFTAGFQNVGFPGLTLATGVFGFNLLSLPVTTQFRVVSIGAGAPVLSPTVTEQVGLRVTMHVRTRRIRAGSYTMRFFGLVSPAEPGARVSVQRLVGSQWRLVMATNAHSAGSGSSSYALTLHRRHGGFFRVFVTPVEGGHVANSSQPLLVHAGNGLL
ncbi:MAG: hypothetical protein ACR2KV_04825 [Solirubrobacteraceae bacterium]